MQVETFWHGKRPSFTSSFFFTEDLPTIPPIDDTNVEEESFTRELQRYIFVHVMYTFPWKVFSNVELWFASSAESLCLLCLSELVQVMGENDETSFSEIFPPENTRKARAAKGLFQLLGKMAGGSQSYGEEMTTKRHWN